MHGLQFYYFPYTFSNDFSISYSDFLTLSEQLMFHA